MNKQLKMLILKIAKFALLIVFLDFSLGSMARIAFFHQNSGKWYRITYSIENAQADIFVFGSSRAVRHYDPDVFEKELGLTCYNAGVEGQHILFNSALEEIILLRQTPKIVLLDIDPWCLYESRLAHDILSDLNPYYYRYPKIIGRALKERNKYENIFLLSKLYQYNSTIAHIVKYSISPQRDNKGYYPKYGSIPNSLYSHFQARSAAGDVADEKPTLDGSAINALRKFISNAQNKKTHVLLVISPNLLKQRNLNTASFREVSKIANEYNVPVMSFANDPLFLENTALFTDDSHLNDKGAKLFSSLLSKRLRIEFGL